MDEIEYYGEWWLPVEEDDEWIPNDSDDCIPGVLNFSPDGAGELELMGTLTGVGSEREEIEVIHGRTKDGEFVTLRDCLSSGTGMSASGTVMHKESFHITNVFTNILFGADEETSFNELKLTYPLLEMWTRAESIESQIPPEYEHFGAQISPVDPVTAELDDVEIELSINSEFNKDRWEGVELTQTAELTITPDDGQLSFEEYLNDYVRHLQHFLSLAVIEPVNPDSVVGVLPSDQEGKDKHEVEVRYPLAHLREVPESKHPHKVLFSLNDIEFEDALQKWFENARGAQTLHNLYFGTIYNGDMFEENRFLSLAIAIEGYQSYLFPDYRLMDRDGYDDLHGEIMDTIPDDSPVRERIDGLLDSIGNQPSLRNQIEMVFAEYDEILPELIEVNEVAKRTTDNRHYLAHALEDGGDTAELGSLARTLQVVIEAFLMDAIGLDSGFIVDKLQENRKYYLNGACHRNHLIA